MLSNKAKTIAPAALGAAADGLTVLGFFVDHPTFLNPLFETAILWLPVLTFALGCYSGHHFRLWMADEERARRERALDDAMRRDIAELDREPKVALYLIFKGGSVEYCEPDDLGDCMNDSLDELYALGMADYETVAGGRKWTLTPRCSRVMANNHELCEEALKVAEEFVRER